MNLQKDGESVKQKGKHRPLSVVTDEAEEDTTIGHLLPALVSQDRPAIAELCIPPGYVVTKTGVYSKTHKQDGTLDLKLLTSAPIFFSRSIEDLGNRHTGFLLEAVTSYRGKRQIVGQRSTWYNARRLTDLANEGAPVTSCNSSALVKFLAAFEAHNQDRIPHDLVSSRMGWLDGPSPSFLWGDRFIANEGANSVELHTLTSGNEQIAEGYHAKGTWEGWCEAISPAMEYAPVRAIMYASFAACLLHVLRIENAGVELASRTSGGKTTALRAAASVWGAPDETREASALKTWDTTAVAIERHCGMCSDLPVILDDTMRAKKPADVEKIVYTVTSGRGRSRGNPKGLDVELHWRTLLVSSGEAPCVDLTPAGGTRARMLIISSPPFGRDNQETAELVRAINRGVRENYGHAGPQFVERLTENSHQWSHYRERYDQLVDSFKPQNGVQDRLARVASIISLAGQLVHELLPMPVEYQDPFVELWPDIAARTDEAHVDIRAMAYVIPWLEGTRSNFRQPETPPEACNGATGWWGSWEHDAVYIRPDIIERFLEEQKIPSKTAITGWKDRGWLKLDNESKNPKRRFTAPGQKKSRLTRHVAIRMEVVNGNLTEQGEATSDATQAPECGDCHFLGQPCPGYEPGEADLCRFYQPAEGPQER